MQLHHLAGVGHLLGSVIQSPLSQWTYLQVRNVLLAMVDLLASLEACSSTEGSSARLKAHIQRIDAYMTNAARERQGDKVYHNALPKEAWSNEQSLRTTVSHHTRARLKPVLTGGNSTIPDLPGARRKCQTLPHDRKQPPSPLAVPMSTRPFEVSHPHLPLHPRRPL